MSPLVAMSASCSFTRRGSVPRSSPPALVSVWTSWLWRAFAFFCCLLGLRLERLQLRLLLLQLRRLGLERGALLLERVGLSLEGVGLGLELRRLGLELLLLLVERQEPAARALAPGAGATEPPLRDRFRSATVCCSAVWRRCSLASRMARLRRVRRVPELALHAPLLGADRHEPRRVALDVRRQRLRLGRERVALAPELGGLGLERRLLRFERRPAAAEARPAAA